MRGCAVWVLAAAAIGGGLSCAAREKRAVVEVRKAEVERDGAPGPVGGAGLGDLDGPTTLPTTRAATGFAPLEAVELFARGRAELLDGRRSQAVALYRRAAASDPESAEVQRGLAEAMVMAGEGPDPVAAVLARVVELEPGDLRGWLRLARVEVTRGRSEAALRAMQYARMTPSYQARGIDSVLVDLTMARVLQGKGSDRAALECYDLVLRGIERLGERVGENAELAQVAARPDYLYLEIAPIYERNGQLGEAAKLLRVAGRGKGGGVEVQTRLVRLLVRMGDADSMREAREVALGLVRSTRGEPRAVALLAEVYRGAGKGSGELIDELRGLVAESGAEVALKMALAEVLRESGDQAGADEAMRAAALGDAGRVDMEAMRRMVGGLRERGQLGDAARLVVRAVEQSPGQASELARVLEGLVRPSESVRLSLRELLGMEFATARSGAVRDYLVAGLAEDRLRPGLARKLLRRAGEHFEPALLEAVDLGVAMPEPAGASAGLLAAMRGRKALREGRNEEAAHLLTNAVAAGADDTGTHVGFSHALLGMGQGALAEPVLAALVRSRPGDDRAMQAVVTLHIALGRNARAAEMADVWSRAAPDSALALSMLASVLRDHERREGDPEALAMTLLERFPDSADAFREARSILEGAGRVATLQDVVSRTLERRPGVMPMLEWAVKNATARGNRLGAEGLIENARRTFRGDAELLYLLSQLAGAELMAALWQELLEEAVSADPEHGPACNNLAWVLAERVGVAGLPRAEALVRQALAEDSDSAMYRDTLGWVLYKRGEFEAAIVELRRSAALAPDDVEVHDHLGDALYRSGRGKEAGEQWSKAEAIMRAGRGREYGRDALLLRVRAKLERLRAGDPVPVAPMADGVEAPKPPTR
jgi:predicted Zn-dependent protease